jgi:hypothetical protein
MQMLDLTSLTFGRWTVLSRSANTQQGQARWLCRCECGTESVLTGSVLRGQVSRSCGCLKSERTIERNTKHGHATGGISKTYHSWAGMVARCTNPKHRSFSGYQGRGITVCERWKTFDNFLADMGEKPEGTSLERRDNDAGYTPENCVWATNHEQAINKRNNNVLEHDGRSMTAGEWATFLHMHPATLSDRLKRGWSVESALTTPVRSRSL